MIDLLIAPCGQLLTLAGDNRQPRRGAGMSDLGLVEDGAIGIDLSSGTISYAGPASALDKGDLSPSCPTVNAAGCVVMPGFVDSHTHLVFAGSRVDEFYRRSRGESYQDIARGGGGIAKTMQATREASAAELLKLARRRLYRLYQNGTTTVEIKTGYGLDRETELRCLEVISELQRGDPGLILATYLGAHLVPPERSKDRAEYAAEVAELLEHIDREGLADFYDIFVDPLGFSQAEAERIVDVGQHTRLGLKLHGDEFADNGTAAWGAAQGALSIDHLGGIGPPGIAALAQSAALATLLPATMFFSGHGHYAPARALLDAGCAMALASDLNPGSSLVYSMPFVLTLAVLTMGLSAEECLVASTLNGAHALGLGNLVGSLEVGKRADLIVVDVPDYSELAYHVGCDLVRDVFIRGRPVKRMGTMQITPDLQWPQR